MESNISAIADQYIKNAKNDSNLKYKDGDTADIVKVILDTDRISQGDTKQFAPFLKGKTLFETCSNVWHFIKRNINYKVDPLGYQYVKTPARMWLDKVGDCKSYSIMTASILKNLGIPFCYRFVSFGSSDFTHVYVVIPLIGNQITIDCVMPGYNEEKAYKFKKDIKMTKIYQMSGIGNVKLLNLGDKDIADLTEGELDLRIAKDRLLTMKTITEQIRGIGSLKAEKYQDSIDMLNDAIEAVDDPDVEIAMSVITDDAVSGAYSIANKIHGIGSISGKKEVRQAKKAEKKAKKESKKAAKKAEKATKKASGQKTKTGKFLQKVAEKVKKGAKAVAKVATTPQRLAVKGILELSLPKAAPFFLYLFINDAAIIAKLPAKVREKRKKAERIANFIVEAIGMKRAHFMGIVRNGILKKYGKEPEKVIADRMKGIAGIGVIMDIIEILSALIQKISSLFGKKAEPVTENDMESIEDWESLNASQKEEISNEVKGQKDDMFDSEDVKAGKEESDSSSTDEKEYGENGGKSIWNSLG